MVVVVVAWSYTSWRMHGVVVPRVLDARYTFPHHQRRLELHEHAVGVLGELLRAEGSCGRKHTHINKYAVSHEPPEYIKWEYSRPVGAHSATARLWSARRREVGSSHIGALPPRGGWAWSCRTPCRIISFVQEGRVAGVCPHPGGRCHAAALFLVSEVVQTGEDHGRQRGCELPVSRARCNHHTELSGGDLLIGRWVACVEHGVRQISCGGVGRPQRTPRARFSRFVVPRGLSEV